MSAETRVAVDVGGTFTDVTLVTPDGELLTAKVPSTADQSEGVLAGIEKACASAGIEPRTIDSFTHAMTVSVNALLERDGAKTALVTTAGFRDVLEIGRQDRPALYDLAAERPEPLVPRRRRLEVEERATPEGVETPVTDEAIDAVAARLEELAVESVAISLLHAYGTPENERRLAAGLREQLSVPVSVSHEVLPVFREYERTSTTVVDAYVRPAISAYVGRLGERAADAGIPTPRIMGSNGGITDAETVRTQAARTVLSGPAAGVVGATHVANPIAEDAGLDGLVTFDMGGTSSDVSLVRDGEVARTADTDIDGQPIGLPMVDIETVGSGGGSRGWVDAGGALRVGPESAGADPGPACYGRGGVEPTVTDAALELGYLGADTALGGELELDAEAATDALSTLATEAGLEGPLAAAAGIYRVANATMTRAIRSVTVERGHDPRRFGLVAFGGAGPVHAAALADRLEMETVVVPRSAGVLSALGLLAADERVDRVQTYKMLLSEVEDMESVYADVVADARGDLSAPDAARIQRACDLRYRGQSFELEVPVDEPLDRAQLRERFHAAHERAYGYRTDRPIELVAVRVSATVDRERPPMQYLGTGDPLVGTRDVVFASAGAGAGAGTAEGTGTQRHPETPIYDRPALSVGTALEGPAVIAGGESTTVVPPGWVATVREEGTVVLTRDHTRVQAGESR